MRLLVAGSRDFCDYPMLESVLDKIHEHERITSIVSGRARGADLLGERWALEHGVPVVPFPADWSKGRHAGIIRNVKMIEVCDRAVVFWDGKSPGTKHALSELSRSEKQVDLHMFSPVFIENIDLTSRDITGFFYD